MARIALLMPLTTLVRLQERQVTPKTSSEHSAIRMET